MNALEIIENIRKHDAEVYLEDDRLVLRGNGRRLPEELMEALQLHKVEVKVALGASIDKTIAGVLDEIRPHLPASLRALPDSKLLALVNWSVISAWNKAARSFTP